MQEYNIIQDLNIDDIVQGQIPSPSSSDSGIESIQDPLDFSNIQDEKLKYATWESLETGRITPLLKEELKAKIQCRRLSLGKAEMKVEFVPPTQQQLSAEERVRQLKRRESNKVAARKCRINKKTKETNLLEELDALQRKKKELTTTIDDLIKEKESLLTFLGSLP